MRKALFFPLILMGCSLLPGGGGGRGGDEPVTSTRGSVCGNPAIKGEVVGSYPDTTQASSGGCGVSSAVRVRSVGGITLSQGSIMNCQTARTLNDWVKRDMTPTVGNMGGGATGIRVAAHYACRTRNHQPGARLSEHAKGRAVDIAAIQLADGSEISVLDDWDKGRKGRVLRKLHRSACGPFGTVLGPESDRHHRDHFHFDTADHGYGPYCR